MTAAYPPTELRVRFDDNIMRFRSAASFQCTDALHIRGTHLRRAHIGALNTAARWYGKTTLLDSPWVSGYGRRSSHLPPIACGEAANVTDAAELDAIVKASARSAGYIVEDSLIGGRKTANELMLYLVERQPARAYALRCARESTFNIARHE
jgi:hypothetical protein